MTAPVTEQPINPHPRDEPGHPIPHMGVLDVAAYRVGGADLSIIVATPLQDDEHSQTRLLDKIQGYLGHVASEQYLVDAGAPPSPETTIITVVIHPDSAPGVFELLARCHEWVRSANASLVVRLIDRSQA